MSEPEPTDDIPDDVLAQVSDYFDNVLPAGARADVEAKIAADPLWKRAHEEVSALHKDISGLQKARAQPTFDRDVTDLIHKRSAGAFFARRTFGDRVPFGVLLVIALIALGAIAFVMASSSTGSLKRDDAPALGSGSGRPSIAPRL